MPRGKQTDRPTDRPTDRVFPVNAVDWPGMLAQLEQQRNALDAERQDIDAVIETVRRPARTIRGPAKPRAAKVNGKTDRHGQGGKIDDAILAPIRKQYEAGATVDAIAKSSGRSVDLIYYYAKSRKWKRPKKGTISPAALRTGGPRTGDKLAGFVTCNWCQLKTEYDPCQNCNKKLKRSWT